MKSRKCGFTLVETLCALVITAIICAMCLSSAIINYNKSLKLSDYTTAQLYTKAMKSYMFNDSSNLQLKQRQMEWGKVSDGYTVGVHSMNNLSQSDIASYVGKTGAGKYPTTEREAQVAVKLYTGCTDAEIKRPQGDKNSDFVFDTQSCSVSVMELPDNYDKVRYIRIRGTELNGTETGLTSPISGMNLNTGWHTYGGAVIKQDGNTVLNGGGLVAKFSDLGVTDINAVGAVHVSFVLKSDTLAINNILCSCQRGAGFKLNLTGGLAGITTTGSDMYGLDFGCVSDTWVTKEHTVEIIFDTADITKCAVWLDGARGDEIITVGASKSALQLADSIHIGGLNRASISNVLLSVVRRG